MAFPRALGERRRTEMSRGLKLFFAWAFSLLSLAGAAHAASSVYELSISADQSSIEIIDVPGTNIAVEAFRIKDGQVTREGDGAADVRLWREDTTLAMQFSARGRAGMIFQIHVPPQMPLILKTSHGSITVTNHDGPVQAKSSVGKIQLGRIRGDVEARSSNGDVWLERGESAVRVKTSGGRMTIGEILGPAVLESSGGSIELGQAHGELIAKAGGGSIHVRRAHDSVRAQAHGGSVAVNFTQQPKNECVLRTSGGSVVVGLAPPLNLRIAVRGEGEVMTDLPIEWKDTHEHYQRGLLNKNEGTLTARAEGGKVTLLSFSAPAAPVGPLFQIQPLVVGAAGEPNPQILLPPATAQPHRILRPVANDAPRIERDEKVWQHADWTPVVLLPTGLRLRDGRWIDAEITALSDFQVGYRKADGTVEKAKLNQVAAIVLHPMPDTFKEKLAGSRPGVVLRSGDFFEGEFSRLELHQAALSSVLFGLKKFNLKTEVSALIIGSP